MSVALSRSDLGRHVFGAATCGFGLIVLLWHNAAPLLYAAAVLQIAGGLALQFRPSAKAGAVLVGLVYLFFALRCMPGILAAPRICDRWGNLFEQLALVTGAVIIYPRYAPLSRVLFGLCTASFSLEQAFYLGNTSSLVPKWIPPSPAFWAVATTIAFALAAVALLTNARAVLAAGLLALMLAMFGFVVWIPLLAADPRSQFSWSETIETFAIAAVALMLAGLLAARRR